MEYSRAALGQVIRELREAQTPKLSQEQLGHRAGYRAGAGVSMSRIENGMTLPGPRRLEGIATALGLTVHELEARSSQRSTGTSPSPEPPKAPPRRGPGRIRRPHQEPSAGGSTESTKDRMSRIHDEFERRHAMALAKSHAFNTVHDRARDDFFMRLVQAAATITGQPAPHDHPSGPADTFHVGTSLSPTTEAALRRQLAAERIAGMLASGAGAAAAKEETDPESAYSAVVAAALITSVSHAPSPPDPQTGATVRATRALLGGGTSAAGRTGILAGTALLTGFLASAASPLFAAGTLAWLARRSRRQNDQLRMELDQAEANLAATQPGFDAVMDILVRATEILGYIAVHARHAEQRWRAQLTDTPVRWSDLSSEHQGQYQAFVEVAARQVLVDSINMTELLTSHGELQARLIQVADDILTLAKRDVELLV